MTLKEMIANDIDKVFLNMDDFAEIHDIDGVEMKAVIDEVNAEERSLKSSDHIIGDSIFEKYIKIYVNVDEYGEKPKAGRRIFRLDGKPYRVMEVDEEMGMYVIYLGVSDS